MDQGSGTEYLGSWLFCFNGTNGECNSIAGCFKLSFWIARSSRAMTGAIVYEEEGVEDYAGIPYVFARGMSDEAILIGLEKARLLRYYVPRNDRDGSGDDR